MPSSTLSEPNDEVSISDFFRPLLRYRRFIWHGSLAITAAAMVATSAYYVLQPTRWIASVGFRPLFAGVELSQYPNKLPFSPNDVIDATVVDQVFEKNKNQEFC